MSTLDVQLLGDFRLAYGDTAITRLSSARLPALLAYLLLHRHAPQPRQHLAFVFWPDSSEAQAQTNLRKLLYLLRKDLPEAGRFLLSEGSQVQWRPDGPFTLDVADFETAVVRAGQAEQAGDPPARRAALRRAVDVYRGDLLPSCYDDWILPERERLRQAFLGALEQLVLLLESERDYAQAIQHAQRLLQHDPLHEAAYRHLMRLHALQGDRAGVVRIYNTCTLVLQRELAVEPSPETQQAYEHWLKAPLESDLARARVSPLSPGARRHNLPAQLTRFIGRERETQQVEQLMGAHRLLTLTGTGGAGKTRLALAAAAGLLDRFPDGVWWVDLAPLSDQALVAHTVASALGVAEEGDRPLLTLLMDYVQERRLLLVLDNCEHLARAAGHLAQTLLHAAPHLRVLATSREVLGIAGEMAWAVPPLSVPLPSSGTDVPSWSHNEGPSSDGVVSALRQCDSVQLFLERAASVLPTFTLTNENTPAVGQICRRLDGMPLAIELAAARIKILTVQQIALRLDNALQLLTGGSPAALPRHQTLRATLDWSYALLSPAEQRLLHQLAVFAGSFTLEAAEAIATCQGLQVGPVLDLLSGLVDKSLVAVEQNGEEIRFRLHEVMRQYAREKLAEAGEVECLLSNHLIFFLSLAEKAEPELRGPQQVAWLNRLELEHDNLRAALQWSLEQQASLPAALQDAALRLAGSLWMFWFIRGHFHEGRRWVESALQVAPARGVPACVSGKALYTAASFAYFQGDYERAQTLSEDSLAACREAEDPFGIAVSLHHLGLIASYQREFAPARELLEEGLELARTRGDNWLVSMLLHDLGILASKQGDLARAVAFYAEALAVARQEDNKFIILYALLNLSPLSLKQGDLSRAAALGEEALSLSRELGEKRGIAFASGQLALVARQEGDYERATALLKEGLAMLREVGDRASIITRLEELALTAQAEGEAMRAIRLFAAGNAWRQRIGLAMSPLERADYDPVLEALRLQLDAPAFDAAWAEGAAMSLEQAIQNALETSARSSSGV